MKRITAFILALAIALLIPCSAFAEGSGNMDGGGGGMEGGTKSNFWHAGEDGVRVTVVRASDAKPVSVPIDLTNWNESNVRGHFGKKSKLHYRNGSVLSISGSRYSCTKPSKALPKVISNGGNANIKAIKRYFCSAETIKQIASIIGTSYDTLINGNYKLLIEPIAYFTFNGIKMAMTATEAALYDQKLSGGLRRKMVSLSHQNLPLSLFLEKSDLGYPAYHGSTSRAQSNSTIISSLGLGIVKFKDDGGEPPIITPGGGSASSTYRVDTDVITSVSLNTYSAITPDSPAKVTFKIGGSSYNVTNIVIPEDESQLVWVKWHTPKKPQTVEISVTADKGYLDIGHVSAKIESLDENPPPNPTAKDRNDRFTMPNIPKKTERTASSWGIWNAKWVPDWQWHENWVWKDNPDSPSGGKWVDKGKWVDEGEWEYDFKKYHAALKSNMKLLPDDKVPTAKGKLMRSGYGVKISVDSSIRSSAPTSHYTCGQTAVTYFPEFAYNTYWRLLDLKQDGDTSSFSFKNNIYSTYNRKVHFTPVWFPDKKYTAYTYLQDAWTPAGMLSINLTDYVDIDGSVFDDWHVGPKLVE